MYDDLESVAYDDVDGDAHGGDGDDDVDAYRMR